MLDGAAHVHAEKLIRYCSIDALLRLINAHEDLYAMAADMVAVEVEEVAQDFRPTTPGRCCERPVEFA